MRSVTVIGLEDGLKFSLGSDVEIIYDIMQNGKAIDAITYELQMTGKKLLSFIDKFHLNNKINGSIKESNHYILTAYDW